MSLMTFSCIICLMLDKTKATDINLSLESTFKPMERFWTNSGFSPMGNYSNFLQSKDTQLALELMSSLPNQGLNNVRIHWLLDSIETRDQHTNDRTYDFTLLDSFLNFIVFDINLNPTIEFMVSDPIYKNMSAFDWEDFTYQVVSRYVGRFGEKRVANWNFETWNEPDLKNYNLLNFTLPDYMKYVNGIWKGLRAVERQYNLDHILKLRGPAGLFKQESRHSLCWGILKNCNTNLIQCPIDMLTFHRKGAGFNAADIFNGGMELKNIIINKFPNLKKFKMANSEADPISNWQVAREWQADVRYAAILVETVFYHWQGIYNESFGNLASISHDNAFLSYFPHNFKQRTLFARFQMNLTSHDYPDYVHFIQKPTFSALGLLARMGDISSSPVKIESKNISYLITRSFEYAKFYSCIIITSVVDTRKNYSTGLTDFRFTISNIDSNSSRKYFIEYINQNHHPSQVFDDFKEPAFPNSTVFEAMRRVHNPDVYNEPTEIVGNSFNVHLKMHQPFVVSIRICSQSNLVRIKNVRLNKINQLEIYIFWYNQYNNNDSRCVKTYQVFFKPSNGEAKWKEIAQSYHVPFLNFFFYKTTGVSGCYKVRAVDFWGSYGKFSKTECSK